MSVKAITWAIDRGGLPPSAKLALLVLANSADDAGVTYLGQKMLAQRCCFSLRTASSQLAHLETVHEIARFERRGENGYRTSSWTVLGPGTDRLPMVDARPKKYPTEVAAAAISYADASHASSSRADSSCADRDGSHVQLVRPHMQPVARHDPSVEPSEDPSEPPQPPDGGRKRDQDRWEQEALAWAKQHAPDLTPEQVFAEIKRRHGDLENAAFIANLARTTARGTA